MVRYCICLGVVLLQQEHCQSVLNFRVETFAVTQNNNGTYGLRVYCDKMLCCICGLLDLDAGRLARSQNPEGPATGQLDPGFLGFPGS